VSILSGIGATMTTKKASEQKRKIPAISTIAGIR
jgi:hypothetical protein